MLRDAVRHLWDDRVLQLSAALSFYSALSIAPLILLLLALMGGLVGREAVEVEIVAQMGQLLGDQGAEVAKGVIEQSRHSSKSTLASVVGLVTLIIGASGVFVQLQEAMNIIWEVKPKPHRGLRGLLRQRLVSLGMLSVVAFLLLVSLMLSAALAAIQERVMNAGPFLHFAVSIGLFSLLFASLFKYLPDAVISWRDVWLGAVTTSVLFAVGKMLIGFYLGRSTIGSAYGAAGSIIVMLVWVYYSSVILFFGAEITQLHAERFGAGVKPEPHAVSTARIPGRNKTRARGRAHG